MALVVSSQILQDGRRNASWQFVGSGLSGDSESLVAKVVVASLNPVPLVVKPLEIEWDCNGIIVQLLWDASSPVVFANLQGFDKLNYHFINGAPNPKAAGFTGNILFTTSPTGTEWNYNIKFKLQKIGVPILT